ncbi:pilus assembly protein TadG-related protein [Pseudomonas sp. B21-015]|uniref:pilus assembly protein TadG-related protein n=1 Tax=Pseudomonas sp. B21-015 TaxID=2895473 RepID=UPI00215E021D|nr:pilus assembly protein TadG-related protein [Pseudomonas sp. B21-015]UVM49805.1 pilus assembly protein TadG-related protein [Pseudomonas sp. B21-015]
MSPGLQFRSPARQRGAIGLMAVLTLGMALVFLLIVVDSGRLYLEKRHLQQVADMAALEAATRNGDCAVGDTASAYATASANRNGFTLPDPTRSLAVACGTLSLDANNLRVFAANPSSSEAIRVSVSHSVPQSFAAGIGALFGGAPAGATLNLTAIAVAALPPPLASLTIRSTVLTIDTSKSATLNGLFGGLLGGSLNLSVAGWNGLVNTNISLLGYLDRLKVDLGLNAAGYDQVLGASVTVSQLIQTTVNVLDPGGTLGATATIVGLQALKVAAGSTTVVLGNMLHVENGSNMSALATNVSVFNLIEGIVQLANKKNGLVATLPINLAGLAQITARVQVLEPPQLSAIGNPKNAALDPLGPNRIYVRTAQVRTLLSIDLPALDAIVALVNAVADLAGPLTNTLNALLNLNLVAVLNSLTCALGVPCQTPDIIVLPGPIRLDVALEVASASSYVTAYSCVSNTNKTLTTSTNTSLVNLKIGRIDAASMFGSNTTPPTVTVQPLKVIDIGIKTCRRLLFLPITCDPRVPGVGGGIDIVADTSVAANANISHIYSAPPASSLPEINQPPFYYSFSTSSIVSSLLNTPLNIHVDMYGPSGSLVSDLGTILSSVTTLLVSAINSVLSPLLDSLINILLLSLGIDLNMVDVGANLSCHSGRATLVI